MGELGKSEGTGATEGTEESEESGATEGTEESGESGATEGTGNPGESGEPREPGELGEPESGRASSARREGVGRPMITLPSRETRRSVEQ